MPQSARALSVSTSEPPRRSRHGHFDLAAAWYDLVFGRGDPAALLVPLGVVPGVTVLDIGGGTGRVAERLREAGATVVVLDVSLAMLARARRRRLNAVVALAEALPVGTDSCDGLVVVDALHHFADQAWAVRELVRVVRPGGRIVIEEPDLGRLPAKLIALGERLAGMQSHFLAPPEIARLLVDAGAEIEAIVPDGWSAHVVATKLRAPDEARRSGGTGS